MKYRVLWAPNADEQLDAILRAATDSTVIAAAARVINTWLASDPLNLGVRGWTTFELLSNIRSAWNLKFLTMSKP